MASWLIPGFAARNPKARKGQPWVRLYREEGSRFAMLPFMTRAIAYQLLRLCNEEGRIDCGDLDPMAVLCRNVGAHGEERRTLRRAVERLQTHGFMVLEGGTKPATTKPRTRHQHASDQPPPSQQPATNMPPPSHQHASHVGPVDQKPTELLNSDPSDQRRTEENRGEERRITPAAPRVETDHTKFRTAWMAMWTHATGNPYPSWGGKEGAQVNRILAKPGGLPEALKRARTLVEDPPAWLARGGGAPSLNALEANWDALAVPGSATRGTGRVNGVADRILARSFGEEHDDSRGSQDRGDAIEVLPKPSPGR